MKDALFSEFAKSREGQRLLDVVQKTKIDIRFDAQLAPGNAHFKPEGWYIALPDKTPPAHMIVTLAHEIRHVQQYEAGLIPALPVRNAKATGYDLPHPLRYMTLFRMCEADASAFQTLFARQYAKETGRHDVADMAQTWSFALAAAANNAPARQMLDAATAFLANETYWKHYREQYLLQIDRIHGFFTANPAVPVEYTRPMPVTGEDIRKFSKLESALDGATGYLDGAGEAFLKKNGFLDLPCKINGRTDTDLLRVTDVFERLCNRHQNPKRPDPRPGP